MNLKNGCLVLALFTICAGALAQEVSDTLELNEVTIHGGRWIKYAAGIKLIQIDSATLSEAQNGTLTNLLLEKSPVYIKEYGSGMTSTISFRGTSANHTAILWNGININSVTLGQTDLSLIPLFTADQVEIQHGSSGSMFGTDAIGGSILFNTLPSWKPGLSLKFNKTEGSFNQHSTGIKAGIANEKTSSETSIYGFSSENNFTFKNIAEFGKPIVRQQNASYKYKGIMQEVYYKTNETDYISLVGWYHTNYRNIQPRMSENLNEQDYKFLYDESLKIIMGYNRYRQASAFTAKTGMVRDYQNYNDKNKISVTRGIAFVEHDWDINTKVQLKSGANLQYFLVDVDNYEKPVHEYRNDIYLSANVQPLSALNISLIARQPFYSNRKAPFTPSVGLSYHLFNENDFTLILKGLVAKGYRVPTFNDRFWIMSGNPNLLPETSLSYETGFSIKQKGTITTEFESTVYQMFVTNWIQWVPAGNIWEPHNVNEVEAKGVELATSVSYTNDIYNVKVSANYGYTRSENVKSTFEGKQLMYVPKHRSTVSLSAGYNKWFLNTNAHYTGIRFYTEDNLPGSSIPGYILTNIRTGRNFKIYKCGLSASLLANNVFDKNYQNMISFAMPGRNYQLSISLKI